VLVPAGLIVFPVPDAREPLRRLDRGAVLVALEPGASRMPVPAGAWLGWRSRRYTATKDALGT